jgi:hypothetical protein
VINKCIVGDVHPEESQDFMLNHNVGLPKFQENIYKNKINKDVFEFMENIISIENQNVNFTNNNFNETLNIQNLFVSNQAYSESNNNYNENSYAFKIFPIINEISNREISPNGNNLLKINGLGFYPDIEKTKVFIDDRNTPCLIKEIYSDEIICETKKFSENLQNKLKIKSSNNNTNKNIIFPGSPGFLRKLYRNKFNINSLIKEIPDEIDISLELRTEYNFDSPKFTQIFEGYFKAPISSDYKFYCAADDIVFVYIWINGVKKPILNMLSWGTEFDFVSTNDKISDWINLKGGNLYQMEIIHQEFQGAYHFNLGVEIKNPKDLTPKNEGNEGVNKILRLIRIKGKPMIKYI